MGFKNVVIVCHPGHELRILSWMTANRPLVLILTDGSGSSEVSRLDLSAALVRNVGATIGPVFGRYTDRQLYSLILNRDFDAFIALAGEIAGILLEVDAEVVAGDMSEGFNSGHDVCRLLIQAAACRVARLREKPLLNYEFPLDRLAGDAAHRRPAVAFDMTEDAAIAKLDRARRDYPRLAHEIDRAVAAFGAKVAASEVLYEAPSAVETEWRGNEPPFYEAFGARRVAAGRYAETITHTAHIRPLAIALRDWSASAP
jgi:hypothetical protein